ncbi:hypothetical protein H2248_011724 [Termitomyces sp. 'cryptogamus']|nr:hypothetical protein H2248_011724 [Termitomyces sp. 'cryptogamus']
MIVLACMVLIIVIQGHDFLSLYNSWNIYIIGIIGFRLYQNRRAIFGRGYSITMVIRVMVFNLLGALALGVVVAYVMTWQHGLAFDMILATLPVLAVLIFGSQLDLIRIWTCRGNRKLERSTPKKPFILQSQYYSVSTHESS